MSKEEPVPKVLFKQRFKGIENFLKRVAFNLGNTPSQTEVKIISCIPIDVTDLQQKILHLERQLDEAGGAQPTSTPQSETSKPSKKPKSKSLKSSKRAAINTAIVEPHCPDSISSNTLFDFGENTSPSCSQDNRKSNVSFAFPAVYTNATPLTSSYDNDNCCMYPQEAMLPVNMDPCYYDEPMMMEEPKPSRRCKFFNKRKQNKNKKECPKCVYYAQTNSTSPFTKHRLPEEVPQYESSDVMTSSYLVEMINKQYKPKMLGHNISMLSEFSSPICRDVQPRCEATGHQYESDLCSCCHGPFRNIDHHINKACNPPAYMVNEMNTGSAYYDINQYDLIPVKEKPARMKKDLDMPKMKEPKPRLEIKCWPEEIRTKHRYPPFTNSHYAARQRADYITEKLDSYKLDGYIYGRKMPARPNNTAQITKKLTKRRKEMYGKQRPINVETSKSCSIDFGNIYPKTNVKRPKKHQSLHPIPAPKKNAECLTTSVNNTECQTAVSHVDANLAQAKTETTLNQIKTILQSVLAEVKISSQSKSQVLTNKPKKDAVVQKGPSHNNMNPSSFMNSFTYSPYAMPSPPYIASQQMSPNTFCYTNGGMKCFQHYPLIIQTPGGRNMCSSCYRHNSELRPYVKEAITIATNTEEALGERSKETEKLIKEIYKSMALTVNMPNKDTSLSEYDELTQDLTPLILKTAPKKPPNKIKNVVQAVSELFIKKDTMDTSATLNSTVESKATSNEASTQSELMTTTDIDLRIRREIPEYSRTKIKQPATPEAKKNKSQESTMHKSKLQEATATGSSESESSSSDSDTTIIVPKNLEPIHKKEKQSLFSKMLQSVKLFKPREKSKKRNDTSESDEETTSDSDDYQTVYSQNINTIGGVHRARPHNLPKRRTHSKISYKQTYPREKSPEKKKSPYMEQEYRRYWDEKLMFQNNKPRPSSDRVYSERAPHPKSVYYRKYEARNALVEPKSIPKTEPANLEKVKPVVAAKRKPWLRKRIRCGEQWRKLILEG